MKVIELINNVKELTNSTISDGILVDYISSLESQIFSEVVEEFREDWINVDEDTDIIDLKQFKYEIISLNVFDEINGQNKGKLDLFDNENNLELFTNVGGISESYQIKNKWGKCSLKIVYRYIPNQKKLDTIDTDILEIMRYGNQWLELYEHFLKHRLYLAVEEYNQANNETVLFNEVLLRFTKYVLDHRYNRGVKVVESRWKY